MDYDKLAKQSIQLNAMKEIVKPIADVVDIKEIYSFGLYLNDARYMVLYYIIYLSGARVTEALELRKRDIKFNSDGNIEFSLLTLKNKEHPIRNNLVIYNDNPGHAYYNEYEKLMLKSILRYIKPIELDQMIFPRLTRQLVFNYFTNHTMTDIRHTKGTKIFDSLLKKINPHYLRHCRLTHLRTEYEFDLLALVIFAGWTNPKPARRYLHLGTADQKSQMIK